MSVVQDFIDAETAALVRLVPVQTPPYGYGTDLSCVSDLTDDMSETDPESVQGMAEMLVRWITTDRGSVADAPERGYNIRRLIGRGMTPDDIRTSQSEITNEALEDDRFASVTSSLEVVGLKAVKVSLFIVPRDSALGPFSLVVGVTPDATLYDLVTGGD